MKSAGAGAAALLGASLATGTIFDARRVDPPASSAVMVADLHVHPFPGDGALPVWELQREAARRGVDLIVVTAHNNRLGLGLGGIMPLDPRGPIVVPGQEITTPTFHMIAAGIERLIDWRLPAREAIAAIHAQGGVAIAAHPVPGSWRVPDEEALRALDGAEVAHPSAASFSSGREQFRRFFEHTRSLNPDLSAIGSSDFHMTAPLGRCRTYLLVEERSAAGALEAIRRGRTVAADAQGRLIGDSGDVARVEATLGAAIGVGVPLRDRAAAVAALVALAGLVVVTRYRGRPARGAAPGAAK